jgi:hypothetical protein
MSLSHSKISLRSKRSSRTICSKKNINLLTVRAKPSTCSTLLRIWVSCHSDKELTNTTFLLTTSKSMELPLELFLPQRTNKRKMKNWEQSWSKLTWDSKKKFNMSLIISILRRQKTHFNGKIRNTTRLNLAKMSKNLSKINQRKSKKSRLTLKFLN